LLLTNISAVGKCAGAAFAELHVALRLKHRFAPERECVAGAFAHDAAAFENDRAETHLRERQRREQPARAGADHQRPVRKALGAAGDVAVRHVRRGADPVVALVAGDHGGLVGHTHVQRIDQADVAAPPRVIAAAEHGERLHLSRRYAKPGRGRLGKRLRRMVQLQFEFGQSQHLTRGSRQQCW
jgi:hypothetical protein